MSLCITLPLSFVLHIFTADIFYIYHIFGNNNPEVITIKIAVIIYVIIQCLFVTAYAEDSQDPELLQLIKACADIGDYNSETTDENELMLRFLYTYRNFEIITDKEPFITQSDNIKMCRTDFVKDAVYKAFRIDAPTPSPAHLTKLGYCENNGYYYFTGGYSEYFATDVKNIEKIIPFDDGTFYVIFSDYYQEGKTAPHLEYSSMQLGQDKDGYYVIAIDMDDNFVKLNSLLQPESETSILDNFLKYLPAVIIVISLCASAFVFYRFFLRR